MASFSYILTGQKYLDTMVRLADAWTVDIDNDDVHGASMPELNGTRVHGLKYAKLSEVRALTPETEKRFQLTLSEIEGYILGSCYCLAYATIDGNVDGQGFFIQSLVFLVQAHPGEFQALSRKMKNLAVAL